MHERVEAVRDAVGGVLREVLHIGMVVEDLERSTAEWARLFGVAVSDRWQSDIGVRVAFFDVGGTRLELVEYTGPIVERFGPVLARREGVHHVCFRVDDLDAAPAARSPLAAFAWCRGSPSRARTGGSRSWSRSRARA